MENLVGLAEIRMEKGNGWVRVGDGFVNILNITYSDANIYYIEFTLV